MKKLLKGLLLLAVLVCVANCQNLMTTNSTFEVVNENIDLTPNTKIPMNTDEEIKKAEANITKKRSIPLENEVTTYRILTKLNERELSIIDTDDFNVKLTKPFKPLEKPIEFKIAQSSNKFDSTILKDKSKTEVTIKIYLIERAGGNLEYIKKGISLESRGNNNYNIVYNVHLKSGLNVVGSYAKYRVDIYIRDNRSPIRYLITKRSFEFTVDGTNY